MQHTQIHHAGQRMLLMQTRHGLYVMVHNPCTELKHLHNVETQFYCPPDVSELTSSVGMTFQNQNGHFRIEKS